MKFGLPEDRRGPLNGRGTGADDPQPPDFRQPIIPSHYMTVDHKWVVMDVKWVTISVQSLYMEGCPEDIVR